MTRADIDAVVAPMLAPHAPELRELALEAAARLATVLHPADLLVYDNYNAVALGWTYTGRTSDVAVCLPIGSKKARLGFYYGAALDDPEGRLEGEGKQFRSLILTDLTLLEDPYIRGLIDQAIANARKGDTTGKVVFKSESAKKRRPS